MSLLVLLPNAEELTLSSCHVTSGDITIYAEASRPAVACPECGTRSHHVHSRYRRTLVDLPWHGIPVRIVVTSRRFFCRASGCPRRIFTERLPRTASPYARRTCRLWNALRHVALALGGEAGRRLLQVLGMRASGDTLLRRLHVKAPEAGAAAPRVLGVDEWAWRKRHRYGTILVDLERHRVVDLLPERSAESFAAWLEAHPSVEVISRDRSQLYAEGASVGAPQAVQVADRWHLLRNLTEAVECALEGRASLLRQAYASGPSPPHETPLADRSSTSAPTRAVLRKTDRRARRLSRYRDAVQRHAHGLSLKEAASEVGVSERTLRRWLKSEGFPERKAREAAPGVLGAHVAYLHRRMSEGCLNAAQLWRELRQRGFGGSATTVRAYVHLYRRGVSKAETLRRKWPSVRRTAWLLTREESEMRPEEGQFVKRLVEQSPEVAEVREAALAFTRLLGTRDGPGLEAWMALAEASALRGFAASLRGDLAAVRAAVDMEWSNGQTEGQVNRLKLIKRQMYGRASFAVLRARVLAAA